MEHVCAVRCISADPLWHPQPVSARHSMVIQNWNGLVWLSRPWVGGEDRSSSCAIAEHHGRFRSWATCVPIGNWSTFNNSITAVWGFFERGWGGWVVVQVNEMAHWQSACIVFGTETIIFFKNEWWCWPVCSRTCSVCKRPLISSETFRSRGYYT